MSTENPYNDGPLIIPDIVIERIERYLRPEAARQWLDRKVPALDGMTPTEWVRHGHSWNDVIDVLDQLLGEYRG